MKPGQTRTFQCLLCVLCIVLFQNTYAQAQMVFPNGITIDPGIERKVKEQKPKDSNPFDRNMNVFKTTRFINDSIVPVEETVETLAAMSWMTHINIDKADTTILFIGMMGAWGFQVRFKNDTTDVKTAASSRNSKWFKDKLTDKGLHYGASATPDSITLVLSKRYGIKKGDKIYGYIKTTGGNFYQFPTENENDPYNKLRYDFEGYFEVDFDK